ncbi:MAG: response regulator [Gemmatimonadales bacterium]
MTPKTKSKSKAKRTPKPKRPAKRKPPVKKAAKAKSAGRTRPTARTLAIVLIDDNRLLREGLTALILNQPGFQVVAACADVDEALEAVRESKPDVVLIDFGLVDHDSLGLTSTVRREVPEARVIVMGLVATQEDVADYVRAGASGFIMKDASSDEFFKTIKKVAAGAEVLPQALTNSLFAEITRNLPRNDAERILEGIQLTNREHEVVGLLGEGLSNKDIATRLNIAVHTVKSHVHNVLEKLSLRSRLEVAAFTHGARLGQGGSL